MGLLLGNADGVDVTGGMILKVRKLLEVSKNFGIETWIINGAIPGNLKNLLLDKKIKGTRVRWK